MHKTHLYITTIILVIGSLAAVYLSKYLSREHVDLRYTLSEPIPLKFGGETGFAVQQISVANNGENAAKDVHLKIPKGIVDFQLDKNYATDIPQIEKSVENFEVVYPELAPQGHFRVVLKTAGVEISRADLSIRHQTGWAIDALNAPPSLLSWLLIFFWAGLMLASIGLSAFQIKDSLTESWRGKADSYARWQEVLEANRPFYISQRKWIEIRNLAINATKSLEYPTTVNIANHSWYRFLQDNKPTYISDTEWAELRRRLSEKLGRVLVELASNAYPLTEAKRLLALNMPVNMSDGEWNLFADKRSRRFSELADDDMRYEMDLAKLRSRFEDGPSVGLVHSVAGKYRERLLMHYEAALRHQMEYEAAPYEWLAKQDVSQLPENKANSLRERARTLAAMRFDREFAYTRPDEFLKRPRPPWMGDNEYAIYKRLAEKALSASNWEAFVREFTNKNPEKFLREPRPAWMTVQEYDVYRRIAENAVKVSGKEEQISKKEKEIDQQAVVIARKATEIETKRQQVLRQLEILDTFLKDPTVLDRIEEYDMPFAPGNLAILRKLVSQA